MNRVKATIPAVRPRKAKITKRRKALSKGLADLSDSKVIALGR
jgi:hypothetical protein